MTTEEQLKTYAAYLPYELDGTFTDLPKGNSFRLTGIERDWNDGIEEIKLIGVPGPYGGHTADADLFKPILYDLSHFEKYFAKLFDTDIDVRTFLNEGFITEENQFESISDMINNYKVEWWPYGVIQLALRHHFNVFRIPAGGFIDKATLKTESND
ncbi:hypothetical protein [uncultured Chryseobacterium sp.]|uniref:hypothetical protein n=1 Tax=uncultured Chryseobacterium sp. TaxID=259322 RepID=UPI0025DD0378|nr:hypothetical protein [uncultured Chryseobacterium sp.]